MSTPNNKKIATPPDSPTLTTPTSSTSNIADEEDAPSSSHHLLYQPDSSEYIYPPYAELYDTYPPSMQRRGRSRTPRRTRTTPTPTINTTILSRTSPTPLKTLIFSYLPLPALKTARLVCKRWRHVIDRTQNTHRLSFRLQLTDFTHPFISKFGRNRLVSELLVGFLSIPYPPDGWNLRVSALSILADYRFQVTYNRTVQSPVVDHNGLEIRSNSLVLPAQQMRNYSQQIPSLAMVVMSEQKLERLFNEFKNVKKLTLSSMALADVKEGSFLSRLQLGNLREVHISQEWDHGLAATRDLLSLSTFPRIRTLTISINCDDDLTLYTEIFRFVGRHHSTMSELQLSFLRASLSHHADPNNNENDGIIVSLNKDHKLDHVVYADLLNELGLVRLKDLRIHALSTEGMMRNNLELHLLSSQTSTLVRLHLTNLRSENMPVWRRVPLLIESCSRTLKHITLDGCFCETQSSSSTAANPPGPFPGSWVKQCKKLESLEVLVCGIKIKGVFRIPNKIKKLTLGHVLTSRQIKTILNTFTDLEELALPQSHVKTYLASQHDLAASASASETTSQPSPVTLGMFKQALSLQNLRKLSLLTKTCKYTKIRRFAAGLIGVVENPVPESVQGGQQMKAGALKRGDVEFSIDRRVFSWEGERSSRDDDQDSEADFLGEEQQQSKKKSKSLSKVKARR